MLKFFLVAHLTYENQWVSLRNKIRTFVFLGHPNEHETIPFFQIGFTDQSGYGSGAASDDSTQYEGSGSRSGYETKSGFPNWADRCGEGCEGEPVQEVSRSLSPRFKASIN